MDWSFHSFNLCGPSVLLKIKESKRKTMLSKCVNCFGGHGKLLVPLCQSISTINRLILWCPYPACGYQKGSNNVIWMSPSQAIERTQGSVMKALGQGFHSRVFCNQLKSKHFSLKKKSRRDNYFKKNQL